MISICIPIYNFDVTELVRELHSQGEALGVPFEIVLMDDASVEHLRGINEALTELRQVKYVQLQRNVGRSKIRNLLAQTSVYPYLVYLDCDSRINCASFLDNYLLYCKSSVVCLGGRTYQPQFPAREHLLHWTVGCARETAGAKERSASPYKSFMTCNFLIEKRVLQAIRFDESLVGYGNEDTLFGFQLKESGYQIAHIDNPVCHIGLENNDEFLSKIEVGLQNLHTIDSLLKQNPGFIDSVKVLNYYYRLKKSNLVPSVSLLFRISQALLRANLFGRHPCLMLFDLYKLGYLCYARNWVSK